MNTNYNIDLRDYNRLIAHVDKTIKEEREEIKLYNIIIKQLEKHNGKQITKRFENYITIDNYSISLSKRYDRYYIYLGNKKNCMRFEISLSDYQSYKLDIDYIKKNLAEKEKRFNKDLEYQDKTVELVGQFNAALKYYKQAEDQLRNIPGFYSFNRY